MSRGDRAFCNTVGAILVVVAAQMHAMPVKGGTVVLELVVDVDLNGVTPVRLDRGTRKLVVDQHGRLVNAIWRDIGQVAQGEIKLLRSSEQVRYQAEKILTVLNFPWGGVKISKSESMLKSPFQHSRLPIPLVPQPVCLCSTERMGLALAREARRKAPRLDLMKVESMMNLKAQDW